MLLGSMIDYPPREQLSKDQCEKDGRRASPGREKSSAAGGLLLTGDRAVEPHLGIGPVTVRRGARDLECLGGLLDGQPGEVAQLDQLGLGRVFAGQLLEGLV